MCLSQGVTFSGLASSWAPFLVAAASLLKPGGRMAFVVPAEIGHAPYAAPLLEYLLDSFAKVTVVAIREKLFRTLSEDCWLLYAEGRGGKAAGIGFLALDAFKPTGSVLKPAILIDLTEWRTVWGRRLRPYVLSAEVREHYRSAVASPDSHRLGEFARVGIGYVSGDNDFFHLRPSLAKRLDIPREFLLPSVRSARALGGDITPGTVLGWEDRDEQALLLSIGRHQDLPSSVLEYLRGEAGRRAQQRYKCRMRTPWYCVPDVRRPSYFLSYMAGRSASLVRNAAGVTGSNSVHSVTITNKALANTLLPLWPSPFLKLSCELEGHALGGGMLKLEPGEALRILFPGSNVGDIPEGAIEDAIAVLQRWRHYDG